MEILQIKLYVFLKHTDSDCPIRRMATKHSSFYDAAILENILKKTEMLTRIHE